MRHSHQEVLVKELKPGFNEFKVDTNYFKHLFTGMHNYEPNNNLNSIFDMMRKFTQLTKREMRMEIYTSLSNSPSKRFHVPQFIISVPEIGSDRSVEKPSMTGNENTLNESNEEMLYIPLMDIHTHPNGTTYPSEKDFFGSYLLTNPRYNIKNNLFEMIGSGISVILTENKEALLYRFNGSFDKFDKFMTWYNKRNKTGIEKISVPNLVDEMNSTGAFTAHYMDHSTTSGSESKSKNIKGKELEEIANLFCPMTFKVQHKGVDKGAMYHSF